MKKLIRAVMGGGVVVLGLGAGAGAANATAAVHLPASEVPPIFPAEGFTPDGALAASGRGVKVNGDCPAYLFGTATGTNATDAVGFAFQSGNAHFYRLTDPTNPGSFQGANGEGIATLIVGDSSTPFVSPYSGQTHLWFGSNSNANGQSVFAETISFHGTTADGMHSITITANPGGTVSASGHMNGWGEEDVTCS